MMLDYTEVEDYLPVIRPYKCNGTTRAMVFECRNGMLDRVIESMPLEEALSFCKGYRLGLLTAIEIMDEDNASEKQSN